MRLFWSVVLAGGLFLTGLDIYESRREGKASGTVTTGRPPMMMMEDGTGFPPPPP